MAQVDEEAAVRTRLAELTAGQPAPPPGRYAAVRRRAVARRRGQLAGAAAAVAVLVAAAIAIPLGLLRAGPPAPATRTRHYHVSDLPPGPGARPGLVATGVLNGLRWGATVWEHANMLCWRSDYFVASADSSGCAAGSLPRASHSGPPASSFTGGGGPQIDIFTVRSDVAYLKIAYTNGQVLTVHPVAVFASRYARYFALPAPYGAAVTEITAWSRTAELAYAIPFTGDGSITPQRWLQPGQPARPSPVTYTIGSGTADGSAWREHAYVGPWGTCFGGAGGGGSCSPITGWMLFPHEIAGQLGLSVSGSTYFVDGEARPAVRYLIVTTSRGGTARVVVSAGARTFFAYAVRSAPWIRWAAYDADGRKLASGHVQD
jgi:hypothetical protein